MPRLFVALTPPEEAAEYLASLRGDVPGARWIAPADLHLTLAFLGEVERIETVTEALRRVSTPSAHVSLERRAAYPGPARARVLVAEGPADASLSVLHRRIAEALIEVRAAEARPYRPHVTLARVKDASPAAVRGWLGGPPPGVAFEVTAFVLFESRLSRTGARYVPHAIYPLSP